MSDPWRGPIPFFTEDELACSCCGLIQLDRRFAIALPVLRLEWGSALTPTSVCRCPVHNVASRGHPRSLHLTQNPKHPVTGTMGLDVSWWDWPTEKRIRFARLAWRLGWAVGLHPAFCHVDRRIDFGKPPVVFTYADWDEGWGEPDITGEEPPR